VVDGNSGPLRQTLSFKHMRPPFTTFLLLEQPEWRERILAMRPCLLDNWTRWLLGLYPTLEGDECQTYMYLVALLLKVDISNVESTHASIRRLLTLLSVQTHVVSLDALSAQFFCQQYRTLQRKNQRDGVAAKGKRRNAAAVKAKKTRRVKAKPRPAQTGGAGGAWRAWMHLQGKGVRPSEKKASDLSQAYKVAKRLRSSEFVRAEALGAVATQARRRAGGRGRAFGKSASQVRQSRAHLRHMWSSVLERLPIGSRDSESAAMALVSQTLARGASLADTLAVGRTVSRCKTTRARLAVDARASALTRYEGAVGMQVVAEIRQALPALKDVPMVAVPSNFGYHVRILHPDPRDSVAALTWESRNVGSTSLGSTMDKAYENLHRTLLHDNCPPITQEVIQSECFALGHCVCSEDGKRDKRVVNKTLAFIKFVCPTNSTLRTDLIDGNLVLRLTGLPARDEQLLEAGYEVVEEWLHIGMHFQSPFRPTFQVVKPVADLGECEPNEKRVYIESAGHFRTLYEGVSPFAACQRVAGRMYKLEMSERPIANFMPQPVPILAVSSFGSSKVFWPRMVRSKGGKAMVGETVDGGDDVDELEGAEHVDHLDGDHGDGHPDVPEPPPEFEALMDAFVESLDVPIDLGALVGVDDADPLPDVPDDPPPLPPPVGDPIPARKRKRPDRVVDLTIAFAGGRITYYESNKNFEARCGVDGHGERCTLTRRGDSGAASSSSSMRGGRCLGLLTLWLVVGAMSEDKTAHTRPDMIAELSRLENKEQRLIFRRDLQSIAESAPLFNKERAKGDGEDSEPDDVPVRF
jgi:hypothetical protein